MKCDELTAIKVILNNHGKPMASIQGTTRYYGISPYNTFYPQDEVDAAIAELKDELKDVTDDRNEFKQLYSEQTEKLCIEITNVDTLEQENRKLKRALWLARAERAKEMCQRLLIQGFDPKWQEVERKCRAKAESYL